MTTENLRDDLAAIPGVASAEVTVAPDEKPVARVWLDGTKDGAEVRQLVGALLGKELPEQDDPPSETPRRRSGLGRGLVDLLPQDDAHPAPTHLQPDANTRSAVSSVSVVESAAGVFVTVRDNKEREATVSVGEIGSIDSAVIKAVSDLFGIDESVSISIEDLNIADGSVVVVSASTNDARKAGAAFVEFGRPSAVARAVFQAMAGMP